MQTTFSISNKKALHNAEIILESFSRRLEESRLNIPKLGSLFQS